MDQTCSPDCPVNRHHTYSAYRHGCRSPQARDDFRLYYKRRREGRAEPRRIDGTGTRRRIQALWAIGHASTTIGYAAGDMSGFNIQRLATRRYVSRGSLDAIRLAYQRLSLHAGTSVVTRKRAAAAGYAPPMAWDDDTIDDPTAQPNFGDAATSDEFDEITVGLAVEGRLTYAQIAVHRPDLIETVRRLAQHHTDHDIAIRLRWPGLNKKHGRSSNQAINAVNKIRRDNDITGYRKPTEQILPRTRSKAA